MAKFLFAFPYLEVGLFAGCRQHAGAAYIKAFGGWPETEVGTFLSDNTLTWEEIADRICAAAERGVGFSVYDENYSIVALLAREIKKRRPDLLVICGGPSATFSAGRILGDCESIDLCVAGEGEQTFHELYQSGFSRERWPDIPGLVFRDGEEHRASPRRELYRHPEDRRDALRDLPSPYLTGVVSPGEAPFLGVTTSRGCLSACTFCCFAALSEHTLRRFPVSRVLEEMKLLFSHYERTGESVTIPINDDHITIDADRCERLFRGMARLRPPNVHFWLFARADAIKDDSFYQLAAGAGVTEISFGMESSAPEVLSAIKKVRRTPTGDLGREERFLKALERAVEASRRHGMDPAVSIILGLPGDTPARGEETVRFVERLGLSSYSHNILDVMDGTPLATSYEPHGLRRVPLAGSPFPRTQHAYDTHAVPILPHANSVLNYRRGPLARALCALTGMKNPFDGVDQAACLCVDARSGAEEPPPPDLPAGTAVLVMPGSPNAERWADRGCLVHKMYLTPHGYRVAGERFGDAGPVPVFTFPGDELGDDTGGRARIEMVEVRPGDPLPESSESRWRLPLHVEALLPRSDAPPPGERRHLPETTPPTPAGDPAPTCRTCPVRAECPRSPDALRAYGQAYCAHHRSGASWRLHGYVLAHLAALLHKKTDWKALPAIREDRSQTPRPDTVFLHVGRERIGVERNRLFKVFAFADS